MGESKTKVESSTGKDHKLYSGVRRKSDVEELMEWSSNTVYLSLQFSMILKSKKKINEKHHYKKKGV